MSRRILLLSAALICFSSQIAFADENGAITGGVGGAVAGAVCDPAWKTSTPIDTRDLPSGIRIDYIVGMGRWFPVPVAIGAPAECYGRCVSFARR